MCIEDIRIGRESSGSVRQATTAGATPVLVAQSDGQRTSLIISSNIAGTVFVYPRNSVGTVLSGFALTVANPVLKFDLDSAGSMLWQDWVAVDVGVSAIVTTLSVSVYKV